jgi:Ni2+-binding GTPase involved in maturation of urease and hydrogenase
MQIHIVGGFLGSGKTSAIVAAAQALMAAGKSVGIITNDQGKYLVDSAFVSKLHVPGVEVTGGCFCCNFNDLDQRIDQLIAEHHPDVIFAESVGSCADMVATVIKPLLKLRQGSQTATSFSVFTDVRLLRLQLKGESLPFSDEVNYIFGKQIEESHLVILNKIDLLSNKQREALLELFSQAYPEKIAVPQCSIATGGVQVWLDLISSGRFELPGQSLEIDYDRYGRGEAHLAWVDAEFNLAVPPGSGRQVAIDVVRSVLKELRERQVPVGHVKFLFDGGSRSCKVSLTTLDEPGWEERVSDLSGPKVHLLVNARVEMAAADLQALIEKALDASGWNPQAAIVDAFHPRRPVPTYRF